MWSNCEHRTRRGIDYFFCYGAEHEFLDSTTAVAAKHDQINLKSIDQLRKHLGDEALFDQLPVKPSTVQ